MVPADRYFAAAPQVLATLKERVANNSAYFARDGLPRKPFYLKAASAIRASRCTPRARTAPVVTMGSPPDHAATVDEGEEAPGGLPLDAILPGLLGEEGGL